MNLFIDAPRLTKELDTLAAFSDTPAPAVTRIVFSDADLRARAWLKDLCTATRLTVREDAVGNMFARWVGKEPALASIGTGSHVDAIPHSGKFDGTVGVLGGLEAIRSLQQSGFKPQRSIELLLFTSEEPTRFGIGCLGSRLLAGTLDPTAGETLRDPDGKSLNQVRHQAGFQGDLGSVQLPSGYYAGFLELHIEQGPILEQDGISLGVVEAIAAPASLQITVQGQGGHAGAVLMPQRHDAFLAAAEIALALEQSARSTGSVDSVATTGMCDVFPSASNSVPSRVRISADIRDIDRARRDAMITDLESACQRVAQTRGVNVETETINRDDPATCDPRIVGALVQACQERGLGHRLMVSRAYHDSLFISRIAPTAMLFIPCRKGISHTPEEFSSEQAIAQGVEVLALALAELAA